MHFLCRHHHESLIRDCDADQLLGLWFEWMSSAGLHYALDSPRQAIPYIGCAFELMSEALGRHRIDAREGITRLALSGIYLADSFERYGDADKARFSLSRTFQQLGGQLEGEAGPWAEQCMQLLLHPEQHAGFFQSYLNLPIAGREDTATRIH